MAVVHFADVPPRAVAEGDIAFTRRMLGAAAGCTRIGVSHFSVPPGARQMPVHVHGDEEEVFFILGGGGLSWQRDGASEIAAGDVVVHRPRQQPHTFLAGEHGLDLLAFGSGTDTGITFLPRAGVMWCGPRWVPLDSPHPFKAEGLAGSLERPEAGERPANVVGLEDVDPGPIPGAVVRALGQAAGAVKAGLNHVTLPAGAAGAPPHCHALEEEFFYVLEGSGTLRLDGDEQALGPRDMVARPPSTGVSHSFRAGDRGLTYLAYGSREPGDSVYYPDSGQVRLRGLGVTIRAQAR